MSRTRQKIKTADYYLFKQFIKATTVDNEIENKTNEIGQFFVCEIVNITKTYRDAVTGLWQTTTIKNLKTNAELDFAIGDRVSQKAYPEKGDYEFIQLADDKPQNDRGSRHNSEPIISWVLQVT